MNESHMTAQDDVPGWRAQLVRRRFIRSALLPTSLIPSGFLRESGTARPVVRSFAVADLKLSHLRRAAFSLVEVAMALGVVSFSLMGIDRTRPGRAWTFSRRDRCHGRVADRTTRGDGCPTDGLRPAQREGHDHDFRFFVLPIRYFDDQGLRNSSRRRRRSESGHLSSARARIATRSGRQQRSSRLTTER